MSACYQHAWFLDHRSKTPTMIFAERPCMPQSAEARFSQEDCNSVRVNCANGAVVEWYRGGTVQEILPNGDKTIFPGRPTYSSFLRGDYVLAEFFLGYLSFHPQVTGNYIEFKQDGGALYRRNELCLIWSPPFPAKETEGQIQYSICDFDNDDEYQFWLSERPDSVS